MAGRSLLLFFQSFDTSRAWSIRNLGAVVTPRPGVVPCSALGGTPTPKEHPKVGTDTSREGRMGCGELSAPEGLRMERWERHLGVCDRAGGD